MILAIFVISVLRGLEDAFEGLLQLQKKTG